MTRALIMRYFQEEALGNKLNVLSESLKNDVLIYRDSSGTAACCSSLKAERY